MSRYIFESRTEPGEVHAACKNCGWHSYGTKTHDEAVRWMMSHDCPPGKCSTCKEDMDLGGVWHKKCFEVFA